MRLAYVALFFALSVHAQDPSLWANLQPGLHPVGYQSSIRFDPSRKYDGKAGRPILYNIWYPAQPSNEQPLTYGQYLIVPPVPGHPEFKGRLEAFARDVVADNLFHRKTERGLHETERAAFLRLLATPTTARLDAPPALGAFPVILYHPGAGGTVEENALLFEYLASNGYIVISSAFQSQLPTVIGNNLGGMERSGPDLAFLAQQARLWPNADRAKLAAIGHSFGAQVLLQWIGSPNCPVGSFASLDTTLEYTAENFKGHKAVRNALKQLPKPTIPVLLFARGLPGPAPRFATFDGYLRHAPRYEATLANTNHDDFLTHGFLGRTLTKAADAEVVRNSYQALCRTLLLFFDATLKADSNSVKTLQLHASPSPVSLRYRPAIPKQ